MLKLRDLDMKLSKLFAVLSSAAVLSSTVVFSGSAFAADDSVSTEGSSSMEQVIGVLGEAFMEAHDDISFTYNPTGSGAGINAVAEGRCDIGLSSRDLTEAEKQNLKGDVVAIDGIVVVVNPQNKVKNLSLAQIKDIYTGKITTWKDVGGEDHPIVLIGREAGSGTRDGFESVTGTSDQCKYRQELTSTGDVITTVGQNVNAIGYASLSALSDKVHAVTVDNVIASEATILDGSYQLQRPFLLVTPKDKPLEGAAKIFMDFALSPEQADLVEGAGVVPMAK